MECLLLSFQSKERITRLSWNESWWIYLDRSFTICKWFIFM